MWIENTLRGLRAPTWPADVLGPIDRTKAERGRELFTTHCAQCHGIKELPNGFWDVTVIPLQQIRTDPNEATGWSANRYDGSKFGLDKKVSAYDAVPIVLNAIRKQLYADNNTPAAEQEADAVFESPCGYKARPLIGVWATPPFLHNGSVRTVFDLLSETRPAKFNVGTREFDPVDLGYIDDRVQMPSSSIHPSRATATSAIGSRTMGLGGAGSAKSSPMRTSMLSLSISRRRHTTTIRQRSVPKW